MAVFVALLAACEQEPAPVDVHIDLAPCTGDREPADACGGRLRASAADGTNACLVLRSDGALARVSWQWRGAEEAIPLGALDLVIGDTLDAAFFVYSTPIDDATCQARGIGDPCNGDCLLKLVEFAAAPADGINFVVGGLCQSSGPALGFEICNGLDDDCDRRVDEDGLDCADAAPDAAVDAMVDAAPDAMPHVMPDAGPDATPHAMPDAGPDATPHAMPDAGPDATPDGALPDEVCDGIDNDGDGRVDNAPGTDEPCVAGRPGTPCAVAGNTVCGPGGEIICDAQPAQPALELCDGIDNDCDGPVDEQVAAVPCQTGNPGICDMGLTDCVDGVEACRPTTEGEPERCDGVDSDCDGFVDEGDPEGQVACETGLLGACAAGGSRCVGGEVVCEPVQAPGDEACNGSDDDCDGFVDEGRAGAQCETGAGGECSAGLTACDGGVPSCEAIVEASPEVCDGLDNDCDGPVDEAVTRPCYPGPGGTEGVGACQGGTEICAAGEWVACVDAVLPAEDICNGIDDDCDAVVDEGDACVEICDNGVDDSSDGLVDCFDPQCAVDPACLEVCDDGRDNDVDGRIDCADADCAGDPACVEICDNGVDDSGDALVDCFDPQCAAGPAPACFEICDNGVDDGPNGVVDCDDALCLAEPGCEEICDDGVGNNRNGKVDCFDTLYCADHPACTADRCGDCGEWRCGFGLCPAPLGGPRAIAPPGHSVAFGAELTVDDPVAFMPLGSCHRDFLEESHYRVQSIVNDTGSPQRVTLRADELTDGPGGGGRQSTHVFTAPFVAPGDPFEPAEGCLYTREGTFSNLDGSLDMAPGETLVVVFSAETREVQDAGDRGEAIGWQVDVATRAPYEACTDALDNDDDGQTDCADIDCGASLSTPGDLLPVVGNDGGDPFDDSCRPTEMIVGFDYYFGSDYFDTTHITGSRAICARPDVTPEGVVFTETGHTPWREGYDAPEFTVRCPAGSAVTGFVAHSGGSPFISGVQPYCSTVEWVDDALVIGPPAPAELVGREAVPSALASCGPGEVVNSSVGRQGGVLDRVTMRCHSVAPLCP